jgi:hypothetical protein
MPLQRCETDGQSGWKWGDGGKCYLYSDDDSERAARKKALAQGIAMGDIPLSTHALNVYRDGTVEGYISPASFSFSADPLHRATLQAPTPLEVTDDFIKVQYRALSQALVWQEGAGGMVVTDFSRENVLRHSAPLLKGVTVMSDHKFSTADYLGIVDETLWTESVNGVPVAGVDAIYKLDIDPNPDHPSRRIVRGVQHGYIKGSSVRVWFDSEKSHPYLADYDFFHAMGSEVDGSVVRFVATNIRRYLETSSVVAGADPLAAPVDVFGNDRAELAASFSASGWSMPDRKAMVALSINPLSDKENTMKKRTQDKTLEAQEGLGVEDVAASEETEGQAPPEQAPDVPAPEVVAASDQEEPEDEKTDEPTSDLPETQTETDALSAANTSSMTTELDAAIKTAVMAAIQEQQARFDAERAELKAAVMLAMQEKEQTERRHAIQTFVSDLQAANLPASFDSLNLVDGLLSLSQEPVIMIGETQVSPLVWAKTLLAETAKYAAVPAATLAAHAKAPVIENRRAALDAAVQEIMTTKNLDRPKALKFLSTSRPELFEMGD